MVASRSEAGCPAGEAIRVRGQVQGVGFRPAVWRLAWDCGLSGDVRNDGEGVLIRVWGEPAARRRFLYRLGMEAPPLSRIDEMASTPLEGVPASTGFIIAPSDHGDVRTGIIADAATCRACLEEVLDPRDRRYRYPFANCTHCGPRLSIARDIPWDRTATSMAGFPLCVRCREEYEDPADRRFHAQPIACPACGPRMWLEPCGESDVDVTGDPLDAAQRLLRDGRILAVKGIGGIHLACDAANSDAVERLRRRKHRYDKPFALMARDVDMVRRYCAPDEQAVRLLRDTAGPIVLMEIVGEQRLAGAVAPGQRCYGFMLPYTPLHHLLMAGLDAPVVLTSGNRCEEPQCIGNREALERLASIADALLLNDREIVNRLDDSVARVIAGAPALIRRARGHAPAPVRLPDGFRNAPPTLAFGGELKSTFCLLRDGEAVLSQHLGDLENAAANAAYHETLDRYLALFEHRPAVMVVDAHPDYLPGKLGRDRAADTGASLMEVQHHHAHVAACMADNGLAVDAPPVLGIALDGLGWGGDGTIWGGEFLVADYRECRRAAAFAPVSMPGGTGAIREPWRMAWAHLARLDDWSRLELEYRTLPYFRGLSDKPLPTLQSMVDAGLNSPLTSSCGRLFDAVAAVTGLREAVSYEGQAAMELEAVVDDEALQDGNAYPFRIERDGHRGITVLEPAPMWRALLRDLWDGVPAGVIAARFHAGLAQAIAGMVDDLAEQYDNAWQGRVALTGGVFQNAMLSGLLSEKLEARGLEVLRHRQVPANDGGLSLGQAVVAAARSLATG